MDEDEQEGSIDLGDRCCGKRKAAGAYACCGLGRDGQPIEYFLIDPPQALDFKALGIEPLGIKIIQNPHTQIYDVFDWVGSESYPNVADYVEEARRLGFSRRISKEADFSLLGFGSRVYLIHSRALVGDPLPYRDWLCPTRKRATPHEPPLDAESIVFDGTEGDSYETNCAGVWWEDIEGGEPQPAHPNSLQDRLVKRTIPCGSYSGRSTPKDHEPAYAPAVFMYFPINSLQVIRAEDGSHEETLEKVSKAQLAISLEDQ